MITKNQKQSLKIKILAVNKALDLKASFTSSYIYGTLLTGTY